MDDILLEIADSLCPNFMKSRTGHYKRLTLEMPQDHTVTHGQLYKQYMNRWSDFNFLKRIKFIETPKLTPADKVVWKGDNAVEAAIAKVVEEECKDMKAAFLDRQKTKLSPILKGRQVIHHTTTPTGHLTDHSNILLEDNSSFTMQTQIRWEYSNRGRVKWIFATSFLDVVKPDGKRHKTLTHARMKSEF